MHYKEASTHVCIEFADQTSNKEQMLKYFQKPEIFMLFNIKAAAKTFLCFLR